MSGDVGPRPDPPGPGLALAKGTTPVPTDLLDRVLPLLRDTELRVLLVVVRQTLGWQVGRDPSVRKERDWLTQSQLMRRTGRASGAVARAVDALVRRGLIDVLDEGGRPLLTAAERRRSRGRLYYRFRRQDRAGTPGAPPEGGSERAKRGHAKPHTTKKSVDKKRPEVATPVVLRSGGWSRAATVRRGGLK